MAKVPARDRLTGDYEQQYLMDAAISDDRASTQVTKAVMLLPVALAYVVSVAFVAHWIVGWAW